jgi:hypothetical protein
MRPERQRAIAGVVWSLIFSLPVWALTLAIVWVVER